MSIKSIDNYSITILGLLLLIVSVMISAAILIPRINSVTELNIVASNDELVNLPVVDSIVYSEQNGSSHDISVNFAIAVNTEAKKNLDIDSIHTRITEVIKDLDYDKIRQRGGIDYVKKEIAEGIEAYVDRNDFIGLYINNFVSDNVNLNFSFMTSNTSLSASQRPDVSDVIRSLRQLNK